MKHREGLSKRDAALDKSIDYILDYQGERKVTINPAYAFLGTITMAALMLVLLVIFY